MIIVDTGDVRFTYRVSGIALHDGHVLLQRCQSENCWFPPGGRAELLESARDTLRREMREEMGVEVQVERLLWVTENFFGHRRKAFHELCLYFAMSLPPEPQFYAKDTPIIGEEEGVSIVFHWLPLKMLANITLYPAFLRDELSALPETTRHIVHTDADSVALLRCKGYNG